MRPSYYIPDDPEAEWQTETLFPLRRWEWFDGQEPTC